MDTNIAWISLRVSANGNSSGGEPPFPTFETLGLDWLLLMSGLHRYHAAATILELTHHGG